MYLGDSTNHLKLILPVSGCGIRFDENSGIITMSVYVIVQMDKKLQQQNDLETLVKCVIPQEMMDFQYDNNKESRNGITFLSHSLKLVLSN